MSISLSISIDIIKYIYVYNTIYIRVCVYVYIYMRDFKELTLAVVEISMSKTFRVGQQVGNQGKN